MQWYYVVNGQQSGPLSETAFQELVQSDIIKSDTLVWNETMSDWVAYGTLLDETPSVAPKDSAPHDSIAVSDSSQQHGRGTGGSTPNADLMEYARGVLSGQWGTAIGICALYFLLSVTLAISGGVLSKLVPFAGSVVDIFVMPPLMVGLAMFFISLTRQQQDLAPGILFQGFSRYMPSVGAYVIMTIIITLTVIVAIVPSALLMALGTAQEQMVMVMIGGLLCIPAVALALFISYMFSMTFFIIADDDAVGAIDSLRRSKGMMDGNKWKFFCLNLRFLGWIVLATMLCGVGWLWLAPYISASYAQFYNDLLS